MGQDRRTLEALTYNTFNTFNNTFNTFNHLILRLEADAGGRRWRQTLEAQAGGRDWRLEAEAGSWRQRLEAEAGSKGWRHRLEAEAGGRGWRLEAEVGGGGWRQRSRGTVTLGIFHWFKLVCSTISRRQQHAFVFWCVTLLRGALGYFQGYTM